MTEYAALERALGTPGIGKETLVVFAALAVGERLAAVAEWREPLLALREFAVRAGAKWWLEVVPEPR